MAFALEEIPVSLDDFLNNQESNGFTILPDPDEDLFEAPRPETFLNRVLSNEDINEKRAPRTQPQAGIVISSAEAQPLACKPQQEIKSSIPEKSKLHLLKQRTQPIRSNTLQPTSITPPNYQTSTLTSTSKTNQRLPSAGISSTSSTTAAHIRLAPDNSTVIPKILKHVHFASIPLHPHVQPQQTAPAVLASTSNMLVSLVFELCPDTCYYTLRTTHTTDHTTHRTPTHPTLVLIGITCIAGHSITQLHKDSNCQSRKNQE